MTLSPQTALHTRPTPAFDRLLAFLHERRSSHSPSPLFESFESQLHSFVQLFEAELLAEELVRFDIDLPVLQIGGVPHHRVLCVPKTYLSAAGPVRVTRCLYSSRKPGEHAQCPLELRAGIVEGFWTPRAAKQAAFVVSQLTPGEGETLFENLGVMTPSKSSLDRLPKQLSVHWEANRLAFEAQLRQQEEIPAAAVTVAASLDGVLVPMKDGEGPKKREEAKAEGKHTRGPAGYREVGCATLSFYDVDGERLKTIRIARMPEEGKACLKTMLKTELNAVLAIRPELILVKLADGAKDNWTYLEQDLPPGFSCLDFYHASEQLHSAVVCSYGEKSEKGTTQFEKLRHILRHNECGAQQVIWALRYLHKKHPRSKKIKQVLGFFVRNQKRMKYWELSEENLPIGSGVTEAACKTLATQRLKRSGMKWGEEGGQAILTLRGWVQSERFERGWDLLAKLYKKEVVIPQNVIPLSAWR